MWQLVYTFPRWDTLISDEIAAHNGDFSIIAVTYVGLVVVNFVHGVCFFHMLKMVGSTTTGVLKGVISVLVFIISHFAFCSLQSSQCFSISKGLSLVVVVLGVACYSIYKVEKIVVPVELAPKRKDLLSKVSTIWLHNGSSTELLRLNRIRMAKNGGRMVKKAGSRTPPFQSYESIPEGVERSEKSENIENS